MSNDIGEDILKAIRAGIASEVNGNGKIARLITKAENGRANLNDVSELSAQLGIALSRLIAANVTPDKLPDGKLYYNIADTFLTGALKDNYDIINVAAQAVQESTDNKLGVNIEPQKAEFPAERVHTIVNAVSDETADWSTIERRLDSPVRNVTESFYNDYVEANAEFRSDAGLKSYIIRETDGNCCAWCSSLAGQYEYPNDVPPDVYARHDNCNCTVTYISDKTKQDVWSKKRYALSSEERKEILERTPKPERFTKQQAKAVEKANLNGAVGVTNSGGNDLTTKDYNDIIYMRGKMSDVEARKWYLAHDKTIPDLIDRSKSVEEQAKQACDLRNQFRTQTRELMADQEKRRQLDIDDPNKSFNELIADKMQRKNLTREQAVEDVLKTATKTRKSVNQKYGLEE